MVKTIYVVVEGTSSAYALVLALSPPGPPVTRPLPLPQLLLQQGSTQALVTEGGRTLFEIKLVTKLLSFSFFSIFGVYLAPRGRT